MRVRRTLRSRTRKRLESGRWTRERSPADTDRDEDNDTTPLSVTVWAVQAIAGDRKAVVRTMAVTGFLIGSVWVSDVYIKFGSFEIGRHEANTCQAPEVVHLPAPAQVPQQPSVAPNLVAVEPPLTESAE